MKNIVTLRNKKTYFSTFLNAKATTFFFLVINDCYFRAEGYLILTIVLNIPSTLAFIHHPKQTKI
jgi:hypothetical protein